MRPGLVTLPDCMREAEPVVKRFARHYGQYLHLDEQDLAQEARLALWLAREQIEARQGEHRDHYIKRRIHGAMFDAARRHNWTKRRVLEVRHMTQVDELDERRLEPVEDASMPTQRRELAERAYGLLRKEEREVADSIFGGLSLTEIAKQRDVTVGRVSQILNSALVRLRRRQEYA